MYLNIGKTTVIQDNEIIGIFDLDNCSQSLLTREFLSAAEKKGIVVNAALRGKRTQVKRRQSICLRAHPEHWKKEFINCKQNGETHGGNQ